MSLHVVVGKEAMYLKVVKKILEQRHCRGIICGNCPKFDGFPGNCAVLKADKMGGLSTEDQNWFRDYIFHHNTEANSRIASGPPPPATPNAKVSRRGMARQMLRCNGCRNTSCGICPFRPPADKCLFAERTHVFSLDSSVREQLEGIAKESSMENDPTPDEAPSQESFTVIPIQPNANHNLYTLEAALKLLRNRNCESIGCLVCPFDTSNYGKERVGCATLFKGSNLSERLPLAAIDYLERFLEKFNTKAVPTPVAQYNEGLSIEEGRAAAERILSQGCCDSGAPFCEECPAYIQNCYFIEHSSSHHGPLQVLEGLKDEDRWYFQQYLDTHPLPPTVKADNCIDVVAQQQAAMSQYNGIDVRLAQAQAQVPEIHTIELSREQVATLGFPQAILAQGAFPEALIDMQARATIDPTAIGILTLRARRNRLVWECRQRLRIRN